MFALQFKNVLDISETTVKGVVIKDEVLRKLIRLTLFQKEITTGRKKIVKKSLIHFDY